MVNQAQHVARNVPHELGFSPQRPQRKAIERDETAIAMWLETTHPEIVKRGGKENATILYCGETGSSLKGATGTTWAEIGVTPTVYLPTACWDRVSIIGGIARDGRVLSNSVIGSVKSAGVVLFLEYVLDTISGQIIVMFDNARIHKSKLVTTFVPNQARLEVVNTPYAPECDPVEWLWSWVKRTGLLGLPARSVSDLRAAWRRGLARVRSRAGLVQSFFAGSALKS